MLTIRNTDMYVQEFDKLSDFFEVMSCMREQ
jgi:hypothetical protein